MKLSNEISKANSEIPKRIGRGEQSTQENKMTKKEGKTQTKTLFVNVRRGGSDRCGLSHPSPKLWVRNELEGCLGDTSCLGFFSGNGTPATPACCHVTPLESSLNGVLLIATPSRRGPVINGGCIFHTECGVGFEINQWKIFALIFLISSCFYLGIFLETTFL